jgi:hypothetical protein
MPSLTMNRIDLVFRAAMDKSLNGASEKLMQSLPKRRSKA